MNASGCFFQHPDTPVISVSYFIIFSMFSSFFPFDSLYSFIKPLLMLLGLISEHYIKIEIFLFQVFRFRSLLFVTFQLQASRYYLLVSGQPQSISGCIFQHPDTLHFRSLSSVSECPSWASEYNFKYLDSSSKRSDTLRFSSPNLVSSVSECSFWASEYYFRVSECILWHPDTPFQKFQN